jgi:hypothetical protein
MWYLFYTGLYNSRKNDSNAGAEGVGGEGEKIDIL